MAIEYDRASFIKEINYHLISLNRSVAEATHNFSIFDLSAERLYTRIASCR